MNKARFLPYLLAAVFFFVNLSVIGDYGISWDEPNHFQRGQAFLQFYLTGQKNYQGFSSQRKSLYIDDYWDGEFYFKRSLAHPPLNDILAAASNRIFFQKLGVLGDVESYHLFEVLASSLLVLVVVRWATEGYGLAAGLVAGLSIGLYPLFLGESHFNIKDPVEASFFTLALYGFWKAVSRQSGRWMIFSALFAGMALSTRFNIVFAPLIVFPWLLLVGLRRVLNRKLWRSLFFYPLVVLAIFYFSWPSLWSDPMGGLRESINYHKGVGYGFVYQPENYLAPFGFNTYALQWIFYTTPLVILLFSALGVVYCLRYGFKEKCRPSFLILFWFLVPVLRVTLPGMGIYGGVRQIMEYIPAMALLSGIGAGQMVILLNGYIAKLTKVKPYIIHYTLYIILLLCFLPIALKLILIHPNQNVYFNPLIGGLGGALGGLRKKTSLLGAIVLAMLIARE